MEENNNQPVTPTTPEVPVTPVAPETPVAPATPEAPTTVEVPVTPVAPEAPVTPEVPVTPEAPVAPETPVVPVTPVAPEAPVAPVVPEAPVAPEVAPTPVAPETPVAPVTPVAPEAPVAAPVDPMAPATPVAGPVDPMAGPVDPMATPVTPGTPVAPVTPEALPQEEKSNKKGNIISIIIIIACVLGIAAYLIIPKLKKEDTPTPTPTPTPVNPDTPENPDTPNENADLTFGQIRVNGITINMPTAQVELDAIGWPWGVDTVTTELAAGETKDGVKIGSESGGAEVTFTNDTTENTTLDNCKITRIKFNITADGSEKVAFVGGVDYSTTPDALKTKMTELGFNNVKEETVGSNVVLTYYKDDNQSNTNDYIAFSFNGETLQTVTLNASL